MDARVATQERQMASELAATKSTVRRWLRRDHWELWMEHWASTDELWEAAQENRLAGNPAQPRPTFQITLKPFCQSDASARAMLTRRTPGPRHGAVEHSFNEMSLCGVCLHSTPTL